MNWTDEVRPPNVSVAQLLYLREAAAGPTWTAAAQRLGVSQPALSQGIAELERRLGVALFERVGRTRVLTPGAKPIVEWATSTIASTIDLARYLDEVRTQGSGTYRIGLIDTAMLYTCSAAVDQMHRELGAQLRVQVAGSDELSDLVRSGGLDAALVVDDPLAAVDDTSLIRTPVLDEPMWLVAPPDGSQQLWVMCAPQSRTRVIAERSLRAHLPDWSTSQIVMESHDPAVLRQMVATGFGASVLPDSVLNLPGPEIVRAHPEPIGTRPLVLIRRGSAPFDPRERLLCDALGVPVG